MNPKDINKSGHNNYLYYEITDNEGQVRGNIIGAQHWIEEKDTKLNPLILEAINRSARFILEQPPGSELLPKESQYFNNNLDQIVEKLNLVTKPKSSLEDTPETEEIQNQLKNIKEQIVEIKGDYNKIVDITKGLQSQMDKLKFLNEVEKAISLSWFDNKLVSFESIINGIIQKKENKTIESLENFNLMEKIRNANQKIQQRLEKEATLERDVEPLKEKIDVQAHKAEVYQAWVKGEENKLRDLADKIFKIYKEAPELDEVHRPRDKAMADKIVEVVKKDNIEATIMMGTDHLVYTERINVIKHLRNTFETDRSLTGWSVEQVKIS